MGDTYDVFMSYHHADKAEVDRIVAALRGTGLTVWVDDEIGPLDVIRTKIVKGLAQSTALVAYYSETYLTRPACQWELRTAFLQAPHDGNFCHRIRAINPEPRLAHVEPIQLRGAKCFSVGKPAGAEELGKLASQIRDSLSGWTERIDAEAPPSKPPSYHWDARTISARHFVGRVAHTLQIHSRLFASDAPTAGDSSPATNDCVIIGIGGAGKSLLAEQYAALFWQAFPGGVFELNGAGDPNAEFLRIARRLELNVNGLDPRQVVTLLGERFRDRGEPYLWWVEDVPNSAPTELARWRLPNPLGKTLFTTRHRPLVSNSAVLVLGPLDPEEGVGLLERICARTANDRQAAVELVRALDHHPLAISVAGAMLEAEAGPAPIRAFLREMRDPEHDVFDAGANELPIELPNGYSPRVANVLLKSIERLEREGKRGGLEFLMLASELATDIIPNELLRDIFAAPRANQHVGWRIWPALQLCLADRADRDGIHGYRVHALVSFTMQRRKQDAARRAELRERAVTALLQFADGSEVGGKHAAPYLHLSHARHLCRKPRDLREARLLSWVAAHDNELRTHEAAYTHLRAVWSCQRRLLGPGDANTLRTLCEMGRTLLASGSPGRAKQLFQLVLRARLPLGDAHPDTLMTKTLLGVALFTCGELESACAVQADVHAGWKATRGEGDAETALADLDLYATQVVRGAPRDRQRVKLAFKAVAAARPSGHLDTLRAMHNFGVTLFATRAQEEAERHLDTVLGGARELAERARDIVPRSSLAVTPEGMGDYAEAAGYLGVVVCEREKQLGLHAWGTLTAKIGLGRVLYAMGDLTAAAAHQRAVLERSKALRPGTDSVTLSAAFTLAETLIAQGNPSEAHPLLVCCGKSGRVDPATIKAQLARVTAELALKRDCAAVNLCSALRACLGLKRDPARRPQPRLGAGLKRVEELLRAAPTSAGVCRRDVLEVLHACVWAEHPNVLWWNFRDVTWTD